MIEAGYNNCITLELDWSSYKIKSW